MPLIQSLGVSSEENKELEPKTVFTFLRYQSAGGRGSSTYGGSMGKIQEKARPCLQVSEISVQKGMSLIGVHTATEEKVQLGLLK